MFLLDLGFRTRLNPMRTCTRPKYGSLSYENSPEMIASSIRRPSCIQNSEHTRDAVSFSRDVVQRYAHAGYSLVSKLARNSNSFRQQNLFSILLQRPNTSPTETREIWSPTINLQFNIQNSTGIGTCKPTSYLQLRPNLFVLPPKRLDSQLY